MRRHGSAVDISRLLCVEVLAEWFLGRYTHGELVREVERLFRRDGPLLPRRVRLDLGYFIEDRSSSVLAECLAMNEEPGKREEFVGWCREVAAQGRDPYRCFGVRREDFCAELGPGRDSRD